MGVNEFIQIGTRIKRIRIDQGITQRDMAAKLGIPYSTYSNYENNNREPNFELIQRIAQALDVSVQYLLFGESGDITSETALYLLRLVGLDMCENADGTYTIFDIKNNIISRETNITNEALKNLVKSTSDYILFLTEKLF